MSSIEQGCIDIWIDEIVPCLKDTETGDIKETVVFKIQSRAYLKKFQKSNGWHINWNEIPKNVWLTYFETSTGKNIFIEGMGMGIKDVHSYYRNLKTTDPSSTIELKELKIITDILTNTFDAESPEKRVYYFEIANMESIKERIAKGEKIDLGYEDKKEKKAGAFDWLDSYTSGGDGTGGTDGGMQSFSQEKPPAANDIQLESIKMDR